MSRLRAKIWVCASVTAMLLSSCQSAPGATGPNATSSVLSGNADTSTVTSATPENVATPATEPVWITSEPRLVLPGQQIAISGQGFSPVEMVTINIVDPATREPAATLRATADVRGMVPTTRLTLPAGLPSGDYGLDARGETSGRVTSATLWIRAAPPSLDLSREALRPEERFDITASGFAPRERVVLYFDGHGDETLTAGQADQGGTVRAQNVALPIMPAGDVQLVAVGSESRGQARHALRILQFDPVATVNANIVPPGEAIGIYGRGFAVRDTIQATLDGTDLQPTTLSTNDDGQLIAPQSIKLPANLDGQQTITLRATRTDRTIRVTFRVSHPFPLIELGNYFGKAGGEVPIAVRYLRPRERFEVFLGEGGQRKKLATFRADDNGWIAKGSAFIIPPGTPAGAVILAFEGEAARPAIRATYTVAQ